MSRLTAPPPPQHLLISAGESGSHHRPTKARYAPRPNHIYVCAFSSRLRLRQVSLSVYVQELLPLHHLLLLVLASHLPPGGAVYLHLAATIVPHSGPIASFTEERQYITRDKLVDLRALNLVFFFQVAFTG